MVCSGLAVVDVVALAFIVCSGLAVVVAVASTACSGLAAVVVVASIVCSGLSVAAVVVASTVLDSLLLSATPAGTRNSKDSRGLTGLVVVAASAVSSGLAVVVAAAFNVSSGLAAVVVAATAGLAVVVASTICSVHPPPGTSDVSPFNLLISNLAACSAASSVALARVR